MQRRTVVRAQERAAKDPARGEAVDEVQRAGVSESRTF
jgi:hypothetical protein